ncbi:MAG: UDP-N-acetylmuramoyl-tripeptide--D-alanyl-D-alanine ligase [Acidobacteriota bacterium]
MTEQTIQEIAAVVGGTVQGTARAIPTGVSIDSRTIRGGDLFFAIVGPHHDGHRFAAEAASRGAAGLVVSDPGKLGAAFDRAESPRPIIVVEDTLRALQDLAAFVRRSLGARVVGITGSGGKTTTKEMTRGVLEAKFQVHASMGNFNNQYGCPLALLALRPHHQVAVLELGMSYHGELARLAEIADPDIGILTNVSGVHLAHFESVDEVADAKAELFEGMREDSIGIFNADDEHCRRIMNSFKGFAFTFGIERDADLTATRYRLQRLEGACFDVIHAHNGSSRRIPVRMRFAGIHNVYNALAAMSAGYMLGIDLETTATRLADVMPLGRRGRILRLGRSVRVIDDSYNSNPMAMMYALRLLAESPPADPNGRKVIVFGDMLELGKREVTAHREIGQAIAASGADLIVGVGPLAAEALAKIPGRRTHHFGTASEAAGFLVDRIQPGDLVLVKGSRGMELEKVVSALTERLGEE